MQKWMALALVLFFSCFTLLPQATALTPEEKEQLRIQRQLKIQEEQSAAGNNTGETDGSRQLLQRLKQNRQSILGLQKTLQQKARAVKARTAALKARPEAQKKLDQAALTAQLQKVAENRRLLDGNLQQLRQSVAKIESLRGVGQRRELLQAAQIAVQLQQERIRLLQTGNQELDRLLASLQG